MHTPNPNTHFDTVAYSSREEWQLRKQELRRQILTAAGLNPLPRRTALHPTVSKRFQGDGYKTEAIWLETFPGYYVGGTVYSPLRGRALRPGVLIAHGHWKHGRVEHRPDYSVPALGVNLALQGYVAFAWDMVGYNDTRQTPHDFGGWREQLWSFNPLGLQLWNSIRALDYLQSRPDVDPARIGVTGASGGGTQTFLLAAVDDRVRVAAPVNMISAHMQGGDPCEEAPGLRLDGANNVEFAAMAAPRPMLVISCTRDWTRHTPVEEFPAIQRIYALFGKPGLVANTHLDAEHNYNRDSREAVYRFFARYLAPEPPPNLEEIPLNGIDPEQLLNEGRPSGAIEYNQLFSQWVERSREQSAHADVETLRAHLRDAISAEWPGRVSCYRSSGEYVVLQRPDIQDRIVVRWLPGENGPPAVVVHANGSEFARFTRTVEQLSAAGRPVLTPDVFQTGLAKAAHHRVAKWFLSYNRSDDAERVQDILTALAWADSLGLGSPELIGLGRAAGVWCLFTAAVAPVDIKVTAELNGFTGADEEFRNLLFVPGIQRAGGLNAALRVLGRK